MTWAGRKPAWQTIQTHLSWGSDGAVLLWILSLWSCDCCCRSHPRRSTHEAQLRDNAFTSVAGYVDAGRVSRLSAFMIGSLILAFKSPLISLQAGLKGVETLFFHKSVWRICSVSTRSNLSLKLYDTYITLNMKKTDSMSFMAAPLHHMEIFWMPCVLFLKGRFTPKEF